MGSQGEQVDDEGGSLLENLSELDQYLKSFVQLIEEDRSDCLREQIVDVMKDESKEAHFGVYMDAKVLLDDDPMLGHLVLRYPEQMLKLFSKGLVMVQERILEGNPDHGQMLGMTVKQNVHARVNWLPGANRKPNISSIRAIDVNAFIQLSGTVIRSSSVKVLEAVRVFECCNDKCEGEIKVYASKYDVGNMVEKPSGPCPHCKKSSSYTELKDRSVCHDYQEIKIQEQVQKLGMGSIPRSIVVILLHDLVDKCKAGDDIVITGIPIHRWRSTYVEERCNLETVIDCNTVEVVNASSQGVVLSDELEANFDQFWAKAISVDKTPIAARNVIVASVCPQLYGLVTVKLAVILALMGCPTFESNTGTKVRGESHLLLVGDPGTGKSQFLRFGAKLSNRSVLTTGTGTTGAGLTCSAVKDGHDFVLEAGALVLADRGVCCIDEFGSIRQNDRATIHEAMEQQSLSVAKAGLVVSLKTRTTILAATNPKGKYDPSVDLSTNTGIAAPLLSRFDMVLVLLDKANTDWDRTISEFILKSHAMIKDPGNKVNDKVGGNGTEHKWDMDRMKAYLAYCKRIDPQLTPEAGKVLTTYYKSQRKHRRDEAGRTTLRLLESLIRLAKAHSRLMARKYVLIVDAVVSVQLVELSMERANPNQSLSQRDFPSDPDEQLHTETIALLKSLGLHGLIDVAIQQYDQCYQPNYNDDGPSQNESQEESDDSDDADDYKNNHVDDNMKPEIERRDVVDVIEQEGEEETQSQLENLQKDNRMKHLNEILLSDNDDVDEQDDDDDDEEVGGDDKSPKRSIVKEKVDDNKENESLFRQLNYFSQVDQRSKTANQRKVSPHIEEDIEEEEYEFDF